MISVVTACSVWLWINIPECVLSMSENVNANGGKLHVLAENATVCTDLNKYGIACVTSYSRLFSTDFFDALMKDRWMFIRTFVEHNKSVAYMDVDMRLVKSLDLFAISATNVDAAFGSHSNKGKVNNFTPAFIYLNPTGQALNFLNKINEKIHINVVGRMQGPAQQDFLHDEILSAFEGTEIVDRQVHQTNRTIRTFPYKGSTIYGKYLKAMFLNYRIANTQVSLKPNTIAVHCGGSVRMSRKMQRCTC